MVTHEGQEISEPETAVTFRLDGTLKGGSTVTILFTAKVTLAATYFAGSQFQNDAYLSSSDQSYFTTDNPYGYSFTDYNGSFGVSMSEEAVNRGGTAPSREAALDGDNGLGDLTGQRYAWLGSTAYVEVGNMTSVTLAKAVCGDKDDGFHETGVGMATRSNEHSVHDKDKGTVDWRLAITNGYTQKDYINKIVIGDVVPKIGDTMGSFWDNNMFMVTGAMNNMVDIDASKYTVYYYTGSVATAYTAMQDAIADTANLSGSGWAPASSFAVPDPNNYFDTSDAAWNAMKSVTAFVVVFDESVHLAKNTSMLLTFSTYVMNIPDDADFDDNYAFTNANNEFYITFEYYGQNNARSNPVSVTLLDQLVEIQGDVWIDEDQDGIQGTANHRDYSDYAIVQLLAQSIEFYAQDNRSGEGVHPTFVNDTGASVDAALIKDESIKHFRFEGLSPAKVLITGNLYVHEELNPLALKGSDPYNYYLGARLIDNTENGDLGKIFKLSPLGAEHYMSDTINSDSFYASNTHALDNNFYDPNTRATTTNYRTSPFFIPYMPVIDQSKDIGFMMFRELEILKVAADDDQVVIKGAKFELYGPFEEDAGTAATGSALKFKLEDGVYTLDPTGTITELVTDDEGKNKRYLKLAFIKMIKKN